MRQPLCDAMRDVPPGETSGEKSAEERTAEARAFRRYAVTLPVLVRPVLPEGGYGRWTRTVLITDISLSGLTFLSPAAYLPGSRLEVQIVLGAQAYLMEALVRRGQWLALPGRRSWQCAAQFLRGEEAARFIPRLARYLYAQGGRE